jgi:shikimate kinase/nucleoside-diphosphate-sugar epimerase
MKILVAGAGYVGARLADLLHAAGHVVTGLTHSSDSAAELAARVPWAVIACDIADPGAIADLPDAFDIVVHCASSGRGGADSYRAVYLQGLQNLRHRYPNARLAYTSSTSVYPQVDGSVVTEESDTAPDRETGQILRQAEDFVLAHGGIVARLAGIYGPDRCHILKNLLLGNASIEGNEGQGRAINQIHGDDAASALQHLIDKDLTGLYNVVDDSPMPQAACFLQLCRLFNAPLPPVEAAKPDRKRGWTHKLVSNAKLKQTGWAPQYPSMTKAITSDPTLLATILDQATQDNGEIPRSPNIVFIGLMGCGKTTVGRIVANKVGFQFVDTDQLICDEAGCSIPRIFERDGEAAFRQRESAALRSLLGRRGHVIATGGGIVTQPVNLALLKQLGYVVWLDANVNTLHRRTIGSNDRPLLQEEDPKAKLEALMTARRELYQNLADLRIRTDDLSPQETSYGVAESARLWFARPV